MTAVHLDSGTSFITFWNPPSNATGNGACADAIHFKANMVLRDCIANLLTGPGNGQGHPRRGENDGRRYVWITSKFIKWAFQQGQAGKIRPPDAGRRGIIRKGVNIGYSHYGFESYIENVGDNETKWTHRGRGGNYTFDDVHCCRGSRPVSDATR